MNLSEKYKGAGKAPWKVGSTPFRVADADGWHVAECSEWGRTIGAANARLIADAPMLACRVAELEEAAALAQRVLASLTDETAIRQTSVANAYAQVREAELCLRTILKGCPAACAVPQNDNQPAADERQAG